MTSTLDRFTLGKTIGSGFSAKVKIGTDESGNQFALKIFDMNNPNFDRTAFNLLQQEFNSTADLQHPNIVRYFEFKESATLTKANGSQKNVAYIVQELVPGGEIFDYIANSGPFSEPVCRYFFK